MAIIRIEGVVYGVQDLSVCSRFFTDAGLELLYSDIQVTRLRTPVNQIIELRHMDDPTLPPAVSQGSDLREVIWGVESSLGLDSIHNELAKDRKVTVDENGTLHTHDTIGYGIAFKIALPAIAPAPAHSYNSATHIGRVNTPLTFNEKARPVRLIHIALDAPKQNHDAANNFYLERLHFKAIDNVKPVGIFMQCEGDMQHHNLLLCHRSDRKGMNHLGMEMRDFDSVIIAGNCMTDCGWKESRRLGRHTAGSNVFRFFHAPCGGRIEFAYDMDQMDKTWTTRIWETAPPHHLWMLKFPGDADR